MHFVDEAGGGFHGPRFSELVLSDTTVRFLELAAADTTPWVLSALIIIVALLLWVDFRRRVAALRRALDHAIRVVSEVDGQAQFKQRFPTIFKQLAENPMLGPAWRAFAPTLTEAPSRTASMGYTRRPKDVFDETLMASAGINLRFFGAIPNFLVGAGLLFSFLGLVAALHFASAGVASDNVAQAQRALADLLAAATFKFATSIAGLGASLIFSWREKAQLFRLQWRVQHFCSLLEARMTPVTTESLLSVQLEEMRGLRNQLQRLSKSVLIRVPEAVEDELRDNLRRSMRPLEAAIGEAAAGLADWRRELPSIELPPSVDREADPVTGAEVRPQASPAADPPVPEPDSEPQPDDAASPDDRSLELGRMLDRRLGNVVRMIASGLERLKSSEPASARQRHGMVVDLLKDTHDRIRDARSALTALLEQERGGPPLSSVLSRLDDELRTTREQLQQAAVDLEREER